MGEAAFSSEPAAFGISRTEARTIDPLTTLILEVSYGTIVGGRISNQRARLANAPVGFMLGACGSTGAGGSAPTAAATAPSVYSATAGALSVLSGRLSYTLGLTGPCLTIDTACSSSLVAAHAAVSAVKLEECSEAAVAGVGILTVGVSMTFTAAGMLSGLGRCHTMDRRADGFCRGEGCGAFLLSARGEGISVSRTAVQQDGPSASLTAPNGSSQQRLLEAVPGDGRPALEAHGTGTALGDPIEVRVVLFRVRFSMDSSQVGAATRAVRAPMASTSLKSNMGHLEAAAAAAGLASVVAGPLLAGIVPVNAQLRGYARAASRTERARTRFTPG